LVIHAIIVAGQGKAGMMYNLIECTEHGRTNNVRCAKCYEQLQEECDEARLQHKHTKEIIKTILPFMSDGSYPKEHLIKLLKGE
jgi:hypothetical protein